MSTDELIMALAASSPTREPLLVNVMATELQNRARRSLAVSESLTEAIGITDDDGIITYVNPPAERLIGLPAKALVGRHVHDVVRIVGTDGRPVGWEPGPTVVRTREPSRRSDLTIVRDDGSRVPVAVLAAPIIIEDVVIGVVASMRDITEEHRMQSELRFHKRLLDAVGDAVMATRPDGTIIYWNAAATKIYGWRADEVMGRSILDVTPTQASAEQSLEIMERLRAGEPWAGQFRVRRKDGTSFLADVHDTPVLGRGGALEAIIGISRPVEQAG